MKTKKLPTIRAAASDQSVNMIASVGEIVTAAASEGSPASQPKFAMCAYTGTAMRVPGFKDPVVVDLAGLNTGSKSRPILKDHSQAQVVGHTTSISVVGSNLMVEGVISGTSQSATEIVATSKNGFPWQASVGVMPKSIEEVRAGATARVNGLEFQGPITIARSSNLKEVSFVALGADDNTSAVIAARSSHTEISMKFSEWIVSLGLVEANLTDDQRTKLNAKFDAEIKASSEADQTVNAKSDDATAVEIKASADMQKAIRAGAAAEYARVAEIQKLANGYPDIAAKAIGEGWDATKTELEVLRASRPVAGAPYAGNSSVNAPTREVVEAALCMSAGVSEDIIKASYKPETIDRATGKKLQHVTLRDAIMLAAQLDRMDVPSTFGDGQALIQASFTSVSLPGILQNTMGKVLLDGYQSIDLIAPQICKITPVNDFKQVTRHRLLGSGRFEKVGEAGELKSGQLGEEKYTNQASTYGQVITLTREMIVNDDLGGLMDLPRLMGQSGANTIDDVFFTLWLANTASFFASGNGNLLTGAGSALGVDGLSASTAAFRKLKAGASNRLDPSAAKDKRPINPAPTRMLVPPELEATANVLYGSKQIVITGSTGAVRASDNPHAGKYEVIVAPQLSDTGYTGNSATAWYQLTDSNKVAPAELVFLKGNQSPQLMQVPTPAGTLGVCWQAFIDFGVNFQTPAGAVKNAGT